MSKVSVRIKFKLSFIFHVWYVEIYKQRLSRRAPIIINNRSALKLAFGEEYDKLYPGSIYSPPSYNENFSSAEG